MIYKENSLCTKNIFLFYFYYCYSSIIELFIINLLTCINYFKSHSKFLIMNFNLLKIVRKR